ncbi:heavy metal response regulator transcription factor [Acinetobacter ihumii]|uniref:heavy metal response regulator transcription factor n=1 Tax=Acinetobacter ihumii TaxID=2483802 RepID=UPI0010314227|nr:heavy metal response regulator transcription factor [Acinetobacter ihumii]
MRILIIEDEVKIAHYLVQGLNESGYQAECVHEGLLGLERLKQNSYQLVILDVMLPDIEGWTILKVLRQFSQVPVLFLTAKDHVLDRVKGLELGADDYLVKPFSYIELLARIKSLLRRHQPVSENLLRLGDLSMDLIQHTACRGEQMIDLSKKEFELLRYFMQHPNEIVSRRQIASHVWNINFDTDTNFIDVTVRRLRSKIDDDHDLKLIHTIRGLGYKFSEHNI